MRLYIAHGEMEPGLEDVRGLAASLHAAGCDVYLAVYSGTGQGLPRPVSSELEKILWFMTAEE